MKLPLAGALTRFAHVNRHRCPALGREKKTAEDQIKCRNCFYLEKIEKRSRETATEEKVKCRHYIYLEKVEKGRGETPTEDEVKCRHCIYLEKVEKRGCEITTEEEIKCRHYIYLEKVEKRRGETPTEDEVKCRHCIYLEKVEKRRGETAAEDDSENGDQGGCGQEDLPLAVGDKYFFAKTQNCIVCTNIIVNQKSILLARRNCKNS